MNSNMGNPYSMGGMQSNKAPLNQDPSMGGFQWRKSPMNPMLKFSESVDNTPESRTGLYVLPWDNLECDYIYAAADPHVFKGAMTMKKFRQVS
jgi:hypothetical protein